MPRPKGSKNHSNKVLPPSSSRTSISSSLLCTQTSIPETMISYPTDDLNWTKTPMNKGGRPRKTDFLSVADDSLIPTSSLSEISGSRVVVNPAVLRYLEQNRNTNYSSMTHPANELFDKNISIDVNEEKDEYLFDDLLKSFTVDIDPVASKPPSTFSNEHQITMNELVELDKLIQDDLFWDFCTCSTDFLTSARLAEWILTHQQSAKLEQSLTVNNSSF